MENWDKEIILMANVLFTPILGHIIRVVDCQ